MNKNICKSKYMRNNIFYVQNVNTSFYLFYVRNLYVRNNVMYVNNKIMCTIRM